MRALALPDLPRWVEAHGIAADPASWRRVLGDGFALGSDRARLVVIAGDVDHDALRTLAIEYAQHTILVGAELAPVLGAERAILHTLPEPDALPDLEGAVVLPPDAPLEHVHPDVAAEIAMARAAGETMWSVYVDALPVAFAYAPWRSAAWFDISVDVDPSARQLGLGSIVATTMIHDERSRGREPVWGADESNIASLALARRLGFTPVDELWVIAPRTVGR